MDDISKRLLRIERSQARIEGMLASLLKALAEEDEKPTRALDGYEFAAAERDETQPL